MAIVSGRPGQVFVLMAAMLAGCAPRIDTSARVESRAMPPARNSPAAIMARPWLDDADGRSGFVSLPRGDDALGARLKLVESAQDSIDLQYFLFKPGRAADLLADRLLEAAGRGVRVRLLYDDVFTTLPDESLGILDAHPGIEVRVFNPLSRSVPMPLGYLGGLMSSNRRMHNKAFIVDNAIAIVGGRNIADEYFALDDAIEFADYDIAGLGPVAADLSETFDAYWNDDFSVPLRAVARIPATTPEEFRAGLRADPARLAEARRVHEGALQSAVLSDLREGRRMPVTAPSRTVTDPPEKLRRPVNSGYEAMWDELAALIETATDEIVIVTPYFVPQRERVALLTRARARGVRVVVITNSLSSTNHPIVHGGYFPYRRELLGAGVELYEARADRRLRSVSGEPYELTLHAKALIADRRHVYIGSLNQDPRSIDINSEMGVIIDSPDLATRLVAAMEDRSATYLYQLELDANGRVAWRGRDGDRQQIWTSDPNAGPLRHLVAWLGYMLPIEGQL